MDKQILKAQIAALEAGDSLGVTLIGIRSNQSGDYKIVDKRIGRGKGGSLILSLRSPLDGAELEIGTPQSDEILNVTVNGTLYGYETEDEIPIVYETNGKQASILKIQFEVFLNKSQLGRSVDIDAPMAPEIHGHCVVKDARQVRGRYGQIVLTVENSVGQTQEIWSYRHSGVITNFAGKGVPVVATNPNGTLTVKLAG